MPLVLRGGVATSIALTPTVAVDVPSNFPPLPPGAVTASDVTATTAKLTWTPGSDPGGSVAGYRIYRLASGVETFVATVTGSPASLTDLTESTSYTYLVRTLDDTGLESEAKSVGFVTSSTDDTAPSVPGAAAPTNITQTQARLNWTASTDNVGGSGLDEYRIFQPTFLGPIETARVPAGTLTYLVTDLDPGTTYGFRVSAIDNAGNESAPRSISVTTLAATDTQAPTWGTSTLTSTGVTQTTVPLSWGPATDNVGVTQYRVLQVIGGTDTLIQTLTGTPPATTHTVSSLDPDTPYTFKVRARDAQGNASSALTHSTRTLAAVADTTPPSAPSGINFPSTTQTTADVRWTAGADESGGSGLAGHRVYYRLSSASTFTASGGTVAAGTNTATIPGLSANSDYVVRVRAIDNAGNLSTPANACEGSVRTAATSTRPDHVFGIVWGGNGIEAHAQEVNDLLDAGGNNRLRVWRLGVEWQTAWNASPTYQNNMMGSLATAGSLISEFDAMVDMGQLGHLCINYVAPPHQQTITLGTGTLTAGNNYIQFTNPIPTGPTGSAGEKWENLAIGGPGLPNDSAGRPTILIDGGESRPAAAIALSPDRKRVYLDPTSGDWTSGTGTYYVGNSAKGLTKALHPRCSATNTDATTPEDLEPAGYFTYRAVQVANQGGRRRLRSIEMGNEITHGLGARPWVDPVLRYRNWCHQYVGAKKADPNIVVYQGSPGAVRSAPAAYPVVDTFNELLFDYATQATGTSGRDYFAALKASMGVTSTGPDPWDVLTNHIYVLDPANIVDGATAAVRGLMAKTSYVYNLWDGRYPIAVTEMGPEWEGKPNAQAAHGQGYEYSCDWIELMYGYQTGEIKWPHRPFASSRGAQYGADLSSNDIAKRRVAARNIWDISMTFCLTFTNSAADGYVKAMYRSTALSSRQFTLDGTPRSIIQAYRNFPTG